MRKVEWRAEGHDRQWPKAKGPIKESIDRELRANGTTT